MMQDAHGGTIDEQLEAIYAEREWLTQEIGCSDAESVVEMVRNLETQLCDLYRQHGHKAPIDGDQSLQLLNYVQEISQHLDGMFSERSVTFTVENEKPVLKATWKQTLSEGDQK